MSMHIDGLPPEMAAMGDMDIVNTIKGDKMRSESTGMMGSRVVVIDGDVVTSLSDMMGNKTGYVTNRSEMEEADKAKPTAKPKIEYTTEKKTIAGYECTKAIVTTVRERGEVKTIVWYTDKFNFKNSKLIGNQGNKGALDLSDLKGYPLSMEMTEVMNGQPVTIVMTTISVSNAPVADSVFKLNTEGYKMMTYKEISNMHRMGGGPR
jgi:hypothetical protein